MVPVGAPFCPECGAPLSAERGAEGSDLEVYEELAKANLLRIRGEYEAAAGVCLSILKRFQNNSTAHTLLGDICAEANDLPQAVQWYELSLDLQPDAESVKSKLAAVRARMSEHEAAMTAKQLGIPQTRPKAQVFALVAAALVIVVGAAAFTLGSNYRQQMAARAQIANMPVDVSPAAKPPEPPKPGEGSKVAFREPEGATVRERAALEALNRLGAMGKAIGAIEEPREGRLTVSVSPTGTTEPEALAAASAVALQAVLAEYRLVTVRVVRAGTVQYMADVAGDKVAELIAGNPGVTPESVPASEAGKMLVNTWKPGGTQPPGDGEAATASS